MTGVCIAGYARSPFTFANKGALIHVRPDDLGGAVVRDLVKHLGIDPAEIEDVIVGCAFPEGEQGFNVARLIALLAGIPPSSAGATINRFCGSSMQAIHIAAGAIAMGAGEAFVCAGIESMTRVPLGGFNPMPNPDLYERMPEVFMSMGETAEVLARKYQIRRDDQEAFAVASHKKAAAAQAGGKLDAEIVSIESENGQVERDGCIRPGTSADILKTLTPAFDADGTVTAGTSSPLTDGAAAVFVCSDDYAKRKGLKVLARIRSTAVAGCAPELMGIGPVLASKKALARAGLKLDDMDLIEINEAFAVQVLACVHDLGLDQAKLNLDGGAIALGHPLGATGARITGKAASLLQREGKRYALATQCIGGGQGIATVLEAA
ncbi:MAG: thiolase family protein [Alphaproteobacteria bacterium]|nr:thiolase family protein [Alphaproteobacteria bacterium]